MGASRYGLPRDEVPTQKTAESCETSTLAETTLRGSDKIGARCDRVTMMEKSGGKLSAMSW